MRRLRGVLLVVVLVAALLGGVPAGGQEPSADMVSARLAGESRVETAVRISEAAFPGGAGVAYLARGDVFADALAAGVLTDGPVLLVPSCGPAPAEVVAEVGRLGAASVVALGGPAAVCDELLNAVGLGLAVGRVQGDSRFTTAVAVSQRQFPDGAEEVYIAAAGDSPDAVAGGALTRGPILLVPSVGSPPPEVAAEIERLSPDRIVVLGGPAAVPEATVVSREESGQHPLQKMP